jgi:uncharacterized membrane protein YGL010W
MRSRSLLATSGVLAAAAGMGALCFGFKAAGAALFVAGITQIELDWRARHATFRGGVAERWQHALAFYRSTHQDPTNRTLHVIGIPLIVVGALGLFLSPAQHLASSPVRLGAMASFAVGWLLNLVGHAAYEKRAPAFSEDGLSFLAGPVWDLQELLKRRAGSA